MAIISYPSLSMNREKKEEEGYCKKEEAIMRRHVAGPQPLLSEIAYDDSLLVNAVTPPEADISHGCQFTKRTWPCYILLR